MPRASSCRTVAPREDIQKSVFVDASRRSGANGKHLSAFERSGLHQRDRGGRWHLEDSRGNGYSYKDQNRTPELGAPLLDQGAESTPDFKPHERHPYADDRDDNGGDRDGHFMGPECKTNDEIVDAEGGSGDNKADWSRRARQFVGCTPSRLPDGDDPGDDQESGAQVRRRRADGCRYVSPNKKPEQRHRRLEEAKDDGDAYTQTRINSGEADANGCREIRQAEREGNKRNRRDATKLNETLNHLGKLWCHCNAYLFEAFNFMTGPNDREFRRLTWWRSYS